MKFIGKRRNNQKKGIRRKVNRIEIYRCFSRFVNTARNSRSTFYKTKKKYRAFFSLFFLSTVEIEECKKKRKAKQSNRLFVNLFLSCRECQMQYTYIQKEKIPEGITTNYVLDNGALFSCALQRLLFIDKRLCPRLLFPFTI